MRNATPATRYPFDDMLAIHADRDNYQLFFDDFQVKALDQTNAWTTTLVGTGATAAASVDTLVLTTHSDDNDGISITRQLAWYGQQNCLIQARMKVSRITDIKIEIGFADTVALGQVCSAIDTPTYATNDFAALIFDTDGATDYWQLHGNKNGTAATDVASTIAPAADTYFTAAVKLEGTTAIGYINGVKIGPVTSAITTDDPLTPIISVANRTASGTPTLTVDYILCAQSRRA